MSSPTTPTADPETIAKRICASEGLTYVARAGAGAFKDTFEVNGPRGTAALKVYRSTSSIDRPTREVDAMMRCSHPNIARLMKVASYTDGGATYNYCLEEFIPGGNLSGRLQAGCYSRAALDQLAIPLIDAIAHIADLDLVHRDIKPDNIMLRSDGQPVVVDFGVVRDLGAESLTPTWSAQGPGTPLYAPPEQLLNQKELIDWRADQFSLGVLLSYAAFGFHPYDDPLAPGTCVNRVMARSEATQQFRDAVENLAVPALARMVTAWPHQRFRLPSDLRSAWQQQ